MPPALKPCYAWARDFYDCSDWRHPRRRWAAVLRDVAPFREPQDGGGAAPADPGQPLADNRFAAFGWGTLAGAITQSSPAVTFITISMLRSGLISAKQGYPIALGAQMGVGLILFIVTVDIRVAALYGIGVGGVMAVTRMQRGHYREAGAMLFGVAALLFGLVLIRESAASPVPTDLVPAPAWKSPPGPSCCPSSWGRC